MKKKVCNASILLGMTILVFCVASVQCSQDSYDAKETLRSNAGIESEETLAVKVSEIVASETETLLTEGYEIKYSENEAEKISTYYGSYRITEFQTSVYYFREMTTQVTGQEADMMVGHIIDMKPEHFISYSTINASLYRTYYPRDSRDDIDSVVFERYMEEEPEYSWESIPRNVESYDVPYAVREDFYGEITGAITVSGSFGTETFYTIMDKDIIIMPTYNSYFLLERCEEAAEEPLPEWDGVETGELLQEIYGEYRITEFFPTKYFPFLSYGSSEYGSSEVTEEETAGWDMKRAGGAYLGYDKLSKEEANMMLGKTVTINEDRFVTYDTDVRYLFYTYYERLDRSENLGKVREEPLGERVIENPDYRVKSVFVDDIYGIRDGILTEDLAQQEYVRIDVYPGYGNKQYEFFAVLLPQMYLVNDGRILLYAMGEYFLLEKVGS